MAKLGWILVALGVVACGGSRSAPRPDGGPDGGASPDSEVVASCQPNPCGEAGRTSCAVVDGRAVCQCDAGRHDVAGQCVPDSTCSATTCGGHGQCAASGGTVACTCDAGYGGPSCSACDIPGGYHADGAGGCTNDACLPSPCSAAHTRCQALSGVPACVCESGFHDEGGCVANQTCAASTCGHGSCSVSGGRTQCACQTGYTGATCAACDSGYHLIPGGVCTNDPCLPDPCSAANKTVCQASAATTSGYTCSCDAGYHDDGVGACTSDVCRPNPCAATNQACRAAATPSGYQCFTPACDDMNPCTSDALVNGSCQHTPLDGTACQTSLCQTGQRCSAGSCGGGTAVTCDDGNPCTRNSCDPTLGCRYASDDTLVPSDGIACTVDSCAAGQQRHVASDALCDDGKWCTGVEHCAPADPTAVAGCTRTNVPAPPAEPWSPCRSYGACSEASHGFPLSQLPAGATCDDRIACTGNDRCTADGACVGTVQGDCAGSGACTTVSPWQAGIDFSLAQLDGTVTLDGGPVPATSVSTSSLDLYLIDRTTGARQPIGGPKWAYSSTTFPYPLTAGSDVYSARVLPGVYDVLYRRGYSSVTDKGVVTTYATDPRDTVPYGEHILMSGLVVGPGRNLRNLDFSLATLSGTITMSGAAVPATSVSTSSLDFYLIDRTTGARQYIGGPKWAYSSTTFPYPLTAGSDHYLAKIVPGTYDVLYRRGYSSEGPLGVTTYATDVRDTVPYGEHLLRTGVVIGPSAQTLDLDFAMATLGGSFTMNGAAVPPSSVSTSSLDFYLIDRSTGARQYVGGPKWAYSSTTFPYPLTAGSDQLSAKVVPGTYDLLYRRGFSSVSTAGVVSVYATDPRDTVAYGEHLVRTGIVLAPGVQTLPIDFSLADVSGTITFNGGAVPPSSVSTSSLDFYLIDRSTGAQQYLGGPKWAYSSTTFPYPLTAGSDQLHALVVPGSYDLLYRRGYSSTADGGIDYIYATDTRDTVAYGEHRLRTDITIAPGAQALPIDFSLGDISGTITFGGAPAPATSVSTSSLDFYLVDRTTGARQPIGGPRWAYSSTTFPYPLTAGSDQMHALVVPGVYDLLYRRGFSSTTTAGQTYIYQTDPRDSVAYGEHLLRTGITVAPGAHALPIDFSLATLQGAITMNAAPVPRASVSTSSLDFYVIDRSTGARQPIGGPEWSYSSTTFPYPLTAASDQYLAKLVPGTYDLLYRRGYSSSTNSGTDYIYATDIRDSVAYGEQRLGMCLTIP